MTCRQDLVSQLSYALDLRLSVAQLLLKFLHTGNHTTSKKRTVIYYNGQQSCDHLSPAHPNLISIFGMWARTNMKIRSGWEGLRWSRDYSRPIRTNYITELLLLLLQLSPHCNKYQLSLMDPRDEIVL